MKAHQLIKLDPYSVAIARSYAVIALREVNAPQHMVLAVTQKLKKLNGEANRKRLEMTGEQMKRREER